MFVLHTGSCRLDHTPPYDLDSATNAQDRFVADGSAMQPTCTNSFSELGLAMFCHVSNDTDAVLPAFLSASKSDFRVLSGGFKRRFRLRRGSHQEPCVCTQHRRTMPLRCGFSLHIAPGRHCSSRQQPPSFCIYGMPQSWVPCLRCPQFLS